MDGKPRCRKSLERRGVGECHSLSQSQSGQLQGADGIPMAMDARRPYARTPGCHEQVWPAVLSTSISALHARVLRGEWSSSLCQPWLGVRPADQELVQAGDYSFQASCVIISRTSV